MPPFPPVPGVCSVLLQGSSTNDIWETGYAVAYTGGAPSAANLTTYAQNVGNSWNARMSSTAIATTSLTQVVVTDLASNTGAQAVQPAVHPGTRGDDPIPQNAAFLISYPSSLRFRGGHFRSYLLVGGHSDMDGYNWHAPFVGEVLSKWQLFLGDVTATVSGPITFQGHVGLKRHGKFLPNSGPPHYILNTPIVIPLPVNQAIAHAQIASQKGRINRRSK